MQIRASSIKTYFLSKVIWLLPHCIGGETSLIFKNMQHVSINKPKAVAFCVSDISKLIMYKTLIELIPSMFPSHETITLDTDGWTGVINNVSEAEIWNKFSEQREHFSPLSSSCSFLRKYPELVNYQKGEPGKIKLESLSVSSVASPRPKCSSTAYYDKHGKETSETKCAGVKKTALQRYTHQQYIDSVPNGGQYSITQHGIQIRNQKVFLIASKKNVFNSLNVYRVFPTSDANLSFPIGCHKLSQYGILCNE